MPQPNLLQAMLVDIDDSDQFNTRQLRIDPGVMMSHIATPTTPTRTGFPLFPFFMPNLSLKVSRTAPLIRHNRQAKPIGPRHNLLPFEN